jgi:deoxycytidine triphosphate deaminase
MRNAQYIQKLIIDPKGLAKPAQVGVDLTLDTVKRIVGGAHIPRDPGKTQHGVLEEVTPEEIAHYENEEPRKAFTLEPGTYSIGFDQGLKPLASTDTAIIYNRSSLGRNGVVIRSSIYDPGFDTPSMEAVMYVYTPIVIEQHARVAQIVIHRNEEANLYDGQYKGEKDFR